MKNRILPIFIAALVFLAGACTDNVVNPDSPESADLTAGESPSFAKKGGKNKVTICHKGKTITVGEPAVVGAHLAHGDTEGPCQACIAPPSGLVSWWPGDGNADDIINGNDGTLQGGATFAAGKVGNAFSLDGENDYVNAGNGANLKIYPPLSIEAWVNPSSVDVNAPTGKFVLSKGDQRFRYYAIGMHRDGRFNFRVEASDGNDQIEGGQAAPNEWQHLAGVHDGSNIYLYVNGELKNSAPAPLEPDYKSRYSNAPFTIAIEPSYMNSSTHWFDGLIDEVSIYNRALSASDLQAIFQAGSDGKCKPGE